MYTTKNRLIRIVGLKNTTSKFKMYNLLGKRLLNIRLRASEIIDIEIPTTIKQGIYIISIEIEKGKINKKIILK